MPKTYRAAQHWDHWLTQFVGSHLLETERKFLLKLLANFYGKHALLIGVPQQNKLLEASVMPVHVLLTSQIIKRKDITSVETEFNELPIASGTVDLVLVAHTLEYIDNPRQLLSEACRIVKPEGHIVILGFNPVSMWGIKKRFAHTKQVPWSGNFIGAHKVKEWLGLADFELVIQDTLVFRPPLRNHEWYRRLKFMEWIGRRFYKPFGGVYALVAKAKVVPLTPIKMRWQQKLPAIRVTIPGPTMRDHFR